jgi:hypothetical protein
MPSPHVASTRLAVLGADLVPPVRNTIVGEEVHRASSHSVAITSVRRFA